MARIKLGAILSDIRGELQNGVYSIWKTGVHYIRNIAPVISNPNSADQAAIRENMSEFSKRWYDDLNAGQRDGWNDWAQTKPGEGEGDGGIYNIIKGNGGIMSGFNAYVMANQWLKSAGIAGVDDAPLGLTPPTQPINVVASEAAGEVTVEWAVPITFKEGCKVRIWIYHHKQLIHKQLVTTELAITLTKAFTEVKGANGAAVLIADYPGDYRVQLDCVDVDGTKSPPSNVALFTIP